jgi:hypothetical protein
LQADVVQGAMRILRCVRAASAAAPAWCKLENDETALQKWRGLSEFSTGFSTVSVESRDRAEGDVT